MNLKEWAARMSLPSLKSKHQSNSYSKKMNRSSYDVKKIKGPSQNTTIYANGKGKLEYYINIYHSTLVQYTFTNYTEATLCILSPSYDVNFDAW